MTTQHVSLGRPLGVRNAPWLLHVIVIPQNAAHPAQAACGAMVTTRVTSPDERRLLPRCKDCGVR